MITGDLKSKVDRVWDAFWSGGISNPLEVIEQITYLLFMRRLDDLDILAENRARRTGKPEPTRFGPDQQDLRWSKFKETEGGLMFATVGEKVFPFLRTLGGDGSTCGEHMKDARFTIPTPALLSRVVDMLDAIPMENRDTTGDLYEYLLAKIASAGVIIDELTSNGVVDPARLYEAPYTDLTARGSEAMFTDGQVDNMVQILKTVRDNAVPAGGVA